MGRTLVDVDRVQEGTYSYIEGLVTAVEHDLTELANACVELLKQTHAKDGDAVTSTWRQVTGEDPPEWLH